MLEDKLILKQIKDLLEDKKATDVSILDVRQHTNIADYFVIATASSKVHAKALLEYLKERIEQKPHHIEGERDCNWILIDYIYILVHIFLKEVREYYDLEWLYLNAQRIAV
ncbi:MAG: ribosome silencing factor [Aquificaceae bacterium]